MVPNELHASIDVDSDDGDCNESEEHLQHGKERRFIEYLFSCAFVDELQHFMSGDMAIGAADAPLEALQIDLLLDLAHYGHVGLRNHQIRGSLESELLINVNDLVIISHLGKEGWIGILIDCSHVFV